MYRSLSAKEARNMKVLENNSVFNITLPAGVETAFAADYNPVLDLYATVNYDDGVSVWEPLSGKVVAQFEDGLGENFRDVLFLPGDHLGVSSSEAHHGGDIQIFTLGKDEIGSVEFDKELPIFYPGAFALSPEKNLLVTDALQPDGVYEIFIDWDNLKFLKSREIWPADDEAENGTFLLCCSQDFKVSRFTDGPAVLSTAKVRFTSEGEVQLEEQETITYYMLDGEEKQIGHGVTGLVHDGQNLIIANDDEIVLLESMTEGSKAHLIASEVTGQIRLNHEGQLMVCEKGVIKLFEYNCNPRSLQNICRSSIRKRIHTGYRDAVNSLDIPSMLKDYLLFN